MHMTDNIPTDKSILLLRCKKTIFPANACQTTGLSPNLTPRSPHPKLTTHTCQA
jgi:hypothetical protein